MLVSQTMRPLLLLCLFSFAVAAAEKPKWWSLQPVVAPPVHPASTHEIPPRKPKSIAFFLRHGGRSYVLGLRGNY